MPKLAPFTKSELKLLNKRLASLTEQKSSKLFDKFHIETYEIQMMMRSAPSGPITKRNMEVPISQLVFQDQNGVGIKNLNDVLKHWDTAPLPELVKLTDNKYWVSEGHHRIALQMLAGRKFIQATVENLKKYKVHSMSDLLSIVERINIYFETQSRELKVRGKKPSDTGKQIRLSRKQFNEWESKSYREQVQYLEEHPNSIFQKLGVTKKKTRGPSKKQVEEQESDDVAEDTSEDSENNESTEDSENNESTENSNEEAPKEKKPRGPGLQKLARKMGVRLSLDETEDNINLKYISNHSGEKGNGKRVLEEMIKQATEDGKSITLDPRKAANRDYFAQLGFKSDPNHPGNMILETKKEEPPVKDESQESTEDSQSENQEGAEDIQAPEMATEHKPLDEQEQKEASDNIAELSEEGALEPKSEKRERVAATIQESAADKLKRELHEKDMMELHREIEKMQALKEKGELEKALKGGNKSQFNKMATVGGMVALAAVAGVALFAVSPLVGMIFGQMMVEHFGTISKAFTGETDASDEALAGFVSDIADYMRNGELPEDFLEAANLSVGIDNEK